MRSRLLSLALLAFVAVGCTSPDAGHESVLVMKPLIFGHGGVDSEPIKTGLSFVAPTTDAIDVNMQPQRVDMEFDDMMTKSGVPVSFHLVGTFKITDSVKLVKDFGADIDDKGNWGFFRRNLDQPIRTAVRDSVKQREMQAIAIDQTSADEVQAEVRTAAEKIIKDSGVPILLTELNVGRVNPPDAVKNQRIKTAEATQKIITEQQNKLAEVQRKMAEEARADADNAYNEKMHLTPEQFVQLKMIEMQHEVCGKKEGGCTFILGDGASPVYNVNKK